MSLKSWKISTRAAAWVTEMITELILRTQFYSAGRVSRCCPCCRARVEISYLQETAALAKRAGNRDIMAGVHHPQGE